MLRKGEGQVLPMVATAGLRRLVGGELEQELCREPVLIAPDGLVEGTSLNLINLARSLSRITTVTTRKKVLLICSYLQQLRQIISPPNRRIPVTD